jgi:transposase
VRDSRVWQELLGLTDTVVESVELDERAQVVVVSVRPRKGVRNRCGVCRAKGPLYDRGEGTRRWRSLDAGELRCYLEAECPRVCCSEHGPTVVAFPWARHGAGHTLAFDDQVAWLASQTSKSAVVELMRVAWRTVGSIVKRVVADSIASNDPLEGLSRIGIDEVSYKKHHKYLTVVVDHDSGHLVWASPGKDKAALSGFFVALGPKRCAEITHISADAAPYIENTVWEYCRPAVFCTDPFHVVSWATAAVDEVRRDAWNDARRSKDPDGAKVIKGTRWALLKNPGDLTSRQRTCLEHLEAINHVTFRAYLLKEQLRAVFKLRDTEAVDALHAWITAAAGSGIGPMVELADKIDNNTYGIEAALIHGLSNALTESNNTKIRLIIRMGFGFKSPYAVIALAMLKLGGHRPPLPGRTPVYRPPRPRILTN